MLNKQVLNINFSQGLDKKTDKFQVQPGKFLTLSNAVFDVLSQLTKRNGFGFLPALPDSSSQFLTTYNNNLTAIGPSLYALSADTGVWVGKGSLVPVSLSVLPLIRSNLNQSQADTAVASNGLVCTVWTETGSVYKYAVADSITGQNIIAPSTIGNVYVFTVTAANATIGAVYSNNGHLYTVSATISGTTTLVTSVLEGLTLPLASGTLTKVSGTGDATITFSSVSTVTGAPRVFLLGHYFVIVFTTVIGGTSHLQYIAISVSSPSTVTASTDIASSYVAKTTLSWDGLVVNSNLYLAYNTTSGGQAIKVTYLGPTLGAPVSATTFVGSIATMMSLAADLTTPSSPIIYVSFYDLPTTAGYAVAVDQNLNKVMTATQFISSGTVLNLTSIVASLGVLTVYYQISNTVSALGSIRTDYINTNTVTKPATVAAGTAGTPSVLIRSVGLASKAVRYNAVTYFVAVQSSTYQPTYFLLNGSGAVISKIAYGNGGDYLTTGLPNITVTGSILQFPYLFKDLIAAVSKATSPTAGTQTAGIYSQTGINLASINFAPKQTAAEIGANLNISGGAIASYDGYSLVENGFFLYPENVTVTFVNSGGNLTAQQYYYQALYEWCDNQGNIIRSAPSIPVTVTTGSTATATIVVPTLRLTYRTANPVKIVVYRWSVAQQNYYQVTSVSSPVLNDTSVDYVTITDTASDATILGNSLIYTTGGVLENIAPPASDVLNLFNNRLWLIDAEDRNLLWYSKQVIEATPVEMSDLLTLYVAPTTGVQGSTGPMFCLASMDDKQIIFKANAAYYINGIGPDNTGANGQYSDPIYITSSVGCTNPQSIALIPEGLMFQSNKGIWLLGRGLNTVYIGAPVESYTKGALVTSAVSVPGTNQVRFSLDSGITLMYDYYVGQWGTFTNSQISSVIYNGLHTYINHLGQAFQETPGQYIDGGNPVLLSLQTGWMSLAGQQGFERFYESLLLGTYYTPFKLNMQYSFDFELSPSQSTVVTPNNYTPAWGGEQLWGSGQAWGGPGNAFKARIYPTKQKCESFQVAITEVYDPSFGVQAGAGLTLTGLALVVGVKRGFRTQSSGKSFG